jgi:hypothetical protein
MPQNEIWICIIFLLQQFFFESSIGHRRCEGIFPRHIHSQKILTKILRHNDVLYLVIHTEELFHQFHCPTAATGQKLEK